MCSASKPSRSGLLLSGVSCGLCLRHSIAQNGVHTLSQQSVALLKATVPHIQIKNQDPLPVSIDQFALGILSTLHGAESCFLFMFSFILQPSDGAHAVPLKPESYPLIHLANLHTKGPASSLGKAWLIPNGNVYLWLFRASRRLQRHAYFCWRPDCTSSSDLWVQYSSLPSWPWHRVSLLGQTF